MNLPPVQVQQKIYGTYLVLAKNLAYFVQGLEKVNRKAAKMKVEPLTLGPKVKTITPNGDIAYEVTVFGEPVQIEGYRFVATLEHTPKLNIIKVVPGQNPVTLSNYLTASNRNCDFCHSNRDRKNTYIIVDEQGEFKQVGGQCLKQFMGDIARKLAKLRFEMYDALDLCNASPRGLNGGYSAYDVQTVVLAAASLTNRFGYQKADRNDSTADWIRRALFGHLLPYQTPGGIDPKDYITAVREPTQADVALAENALAWFNSLTEEDIYKSNFLTNLWPFIKADYITSKSVALTAALIPAYLSSVARSEKEATRKPSEWIGTVGEKLFVPEAEVVYAQTVAGRYGVSTITKAADPCGNVVSWFHQGAALNRGEKVAVAGRVKAHDDYKGRKTTTLTRVTVDLL